MRFNLEWASWVGTASRASAWLAPTSTPWFTLTMARATTETLHLCPPSLSLLPFFPPPPSHPPSSLPHPPSVSPSHPLLHQPLQPYGGGMFGRSLDETMQVEARLGGNYVPVLLHRCIKFVRDYGMKWARSDCNNVRRESVRREICLDRWS